MIIKGNIYDRLSQRSEAAEALARQDAEEVRIAAEAAVEVLRQPPALVMDAENNALCIAGLNLLMPQGFAFRDINTTLEFAGCHVQFDARRRRAPEGLELNKAVELFTNELRKSHSEIDLVRQVSTALAGHPAISLDYQFNVGQERRHGRSVCTIIVSADGNGREWFSASTVIDPSKSQLADWLIAFDAMLAGMTAE
ncbi:hypothetical protein N7592_12530 [Pseudomonas juntendi]|uniref:Uncharacterized protein n=1 Tax=Pseudomonas juntendi TaxID=2666183 RepID=A0ABD4YG70_9PSED|nr:MULTISPECIES: hypothetical protein [Pseudomonas]MCQ1988532.1 hypothetical protein [Pseudomonas sp. Eb3]MCF3155177.1 hypothetical protein [Pseudomonas juntendi]MDG9874015.1 hypothetical protein [Pseudomonas juntendi]MDH0043816.1 hypothetical protein [Pseudomonas juntendi]MDH0757563.1 hypothetical protein [Pseudomonas juntendi]